MHHDKRLLHHLLTYPYLHKGLTRFLQLWLIAVYMKEIIKYTKGVNVLILLRGRRKKQAKHFQSSCQAYGFWDQIASNSKIT